MSALPVLLPFRPSREVVHAAIERALLPKVFVPTPIQEDILAALDGKALRTDAIAHKVDCNRRSLFKDRGGLPELRARGLVDWHRRIGFYRPDALPPELQQALARLEGGQPS